ncbi:MAG TPA: glutathione S-transferase family protein [Polyangiaceae bacterium]|jgi:glutathione S-transferase
MITLYAFGRLFAAGHGMTRDLRVQWALEELGLPYQVRPMDHTGGETHTAEFRGLSPFEQLPVIDDDGFVVAESAAILLYLAEKAGKLVPKDFQGRTTVMQWCFAAVSTVEPTIQTIGIMNVIGSSDTATRTALEQVAARFLTSLEAWLGERTYVTGAEFTVADIVLTTVLQRARRGDLLREFPRCDTYRKRCEARPAWARATAAYEVRLGDEPGTVAKAIERNGNRSSGST